MRIIVILVQVATSVRAEEAASITDHSLIPNGGGHEENKSNKK